MSRAISVPCLLAAGALVAFSLAQPAAGYGGGHGGSGGAHYGGSLGGAHYGGGFGGAHYGGSFGGMHYGGSHISHYGGGFGASHFGTGSIGHYGGSSVGLGHYRSGSYVLPRISSGIGSIYHSPVYSPRYSIGGAGAYHSPAYYGSIGHGLGTGPLHGSIHGALGGPANRVAGHTGVNSAFRGNTSHNGQAFRSTWNGDRSLWRSGEWNRSGDRLGRSGFGRDFDHDRFFGSGLGFWGFGGYPFLDFSYLPYFSTGYPYDYFYSYPYGYSYGYGAPYYGASDYGYSGDYGYAAPAVAYSAPGYEASVGTGITQPAVSDENANPPPASESPAPDSKFYTSAFDAFHRGDYRGAVRWAEHAAIESPQDIRVHRLMAQTMFALGNYRGAAIEAHAALALGAPMDWNTLQADYGDVSAYTTQLRALEQDSSSHPSAPEARFLLGYQYLMLGYPQQARDQFAEAVKLVPADKLAAKLLASLGGGGAKVSNAAATKSP